MDQLPFSNEFRSRMSLPWHRFETTAHAELESDNALLPQENVDLEVDYLNPETLNK